MTDNKQHTKRQHYVPYFYLESFSDEKKQVFVLSIDQKRIYKQNIRNVCVKNDLYETRWGDSETVNGKYVLDNQVENYLGSVETKAGVLIERIIYNLNTGVEFIELDDTDKDTLIELLSTQYLRTPYMMNDTIQYYSGVEVYSEIRVLFDSISKFFKENNLGSAHPLIKHSIYIGMFDKNLTGSPLNVVYNEFSNMKIIFWRSRNPFVTASFPLLIDEYDNVAQRIVFPIDSNSAIVLFDARIPLITEGIVLDILPQITSDVNSKFLKQYKKGFVEFLIAKEEKTLQRLI